VDVIAALRDFVLPLLTVGLAGVVAHLELRGGLTRQIQLHAATALVTAALIWALGHGPADAWRVGALVSVCLAIARIDLAKLIIPDTLVLGLATLALTAPLHISIIEQIIGAVVMTAVFLGVRFAYRAWRGVEGLGLGDVKLAAVMGASLGLDNALPARSSTAQ
jgi:leader peptidase (prepilin peptidase) / N-methyltransferase